MQAVDEADQRIADATTDADRRQRQDDRRRVLDQLDRWASPAAPQTPVRAEVIVFPGTAAERRFRFDMTVQRTGQLLTLGEVEVTDAMIRAAREGR